jgi:hypothetical protein
MKRRGFAAPTKNNWRVGSSTTVLQQLQYSYSITAVNRQYNVATLYWRFLDRAGVVPYVLRGDLFGGELIENARASGMGNRISEIIVREDADHGVGESVGVFGGNEESSHFIVNDFRETPNVACNDRGATQLPFENDDAERLGAARDY